MSSDFVRNAANRFMELISPAREAYGDDASFSYLAVKSGGSVRLIRGSLWLNVRTSRIPYKTFESARVRAGHFRLSEVGMSFEDFIDKVLSGSIPTPVGEFEFPPNPDSGQHGALLTPFSSQPPQCRFSILSIFGAQTGNSLPQPDIDWELRAGSDPYDSLMEVLAEVQPGTLTGVNTIDIVAMNTAAIENFSSIVGEKATIRVVKANCADASKISIGYRVIDKGKVIKRGIASGESLSWSNEAEEPVGTFVMEVPRASIVHAFASYNGLAQHHYYLTDPDCLQNSRRAVYETIDPKLEGLLDVLVRAQGVRPPSREFETAISWLSWMLGFATIQVHHTEAPDLVLACPNGNIAVIECTTHAIDGNKIAKLFVRSQAIRAALQRANSQHLHVLPVIITSRNREDVGLAMSAAILHGVHVVTGDRLSELVERTLIAPDANQLFELAERDTADAKARLEQQAILQNAQH